MESYSLSDVERGYHWLGHNACYTEVLVLHPEYRPGDYSWNREHESWPLISYITSVAGLLSLVREYAGSRMVCYGINPRPQIFAKENGRLASAKETDITTGQNILLDLDLHGAVTLERLDRLKRFLSRADEYFTGLGLRRPVRASSGGGSHLLFAHPPIPTTEYPDVRERLRAFRNNFYRAVRGDLDRLEVRLDSTQDLRRMAKVWGTCKPGVGVISRFYGRERVEDTAFREHLLSLDLQPAAFMNVPGVTISAALPSWFTELLTTDQRLGRLWRNDGKTSGDQSNSGYDYTIARYLIRQGRNNPDELGTILALRPDGHVKRNQKGNGYVSRTVHNALATTTVKP